MNEFYHNLFERLSEAKKMVALQVEKEQAEQKNLARDPSKLEMVLSFLNVCLIELEREP